MNNFIYDTPTKVYFGKGEEKKVGTIISQYGVKKVLIHYGSGSAKKSGLIDMVKASLEAEGLEYVYESLWNSVNNRKISAGKMALIAFLVLMMFAKIL